MPYSDPTQYKINHKDYSNSYAVILCDGVTELSSEKLKLLTLVNGEDGASMKINSNNYSFILKAYKVFLN